MVQGESGDGKEEYFVGGPRAEYAKVVVDHNKGFRRNEVEELRKVFFTNGGRVPGVLQLYQWHRSFGRYDYNIEGQLDCARRGDRVDEQGNFNGSPYT